MAEVLNIEVVYALPERQDLVKLALPSGSTLRDAVQASGLPARHPNIDLDYGKFGIYGSLTAPDTLLRDRDRVEIYRPLLADPKEVRRQRAARTKAAKQGPAGAA